MLIPLHSVAETLIPDACQKIIPTQTLVKKAYYFSLGGKARMRKVHVLSLFSNSVFRWRQMNASDMHAFMHEWLTDTHELSLSIYVHIYMRMCMCACPYILYECAWACVFKLYVCMCRCRCTRMSVRLPGVYMYVYAFISLSKCKCMCT